MTWSIFNGLGKRDQRFDQLTHSKGNSYTKMFSVLLKVVLCWGLSYYFMNVAANVASVRSMSNIDNQMMNDLGFEFVPSVQLLWLTDFFDGIMVAIMGLLVVLSPTKFELICKILMTSTLCNFLRVTTLVSTSCVDPRATCEVVTTNIWTTVALHRCGDCMYSGHTILLALGAISWHFYSPAKFQIFSRGLVWLMSFFGGLCIISNRSHYTSDVLIAFYITIGSWFAVNYIWNRAISTVDDIDEDEESGKVMSYSRPQGWLPVYEASPAFPSHDDDNNSSRSSSSETRLLQQLH